MGFLSGIHLVGAILGFVIGAFGFIIVKYWIRPVSGYGRLKRRIGNAVDRHLSLVAEEENKNGEKGLGDSRKQLRKLAQELTDAFHQELPNWYRIRLRARGEAPAEAAVGLMKFSGSRQIEPARKGAETIRKRLHLQNRKSS